MNLFELFFFFAKIGSITFGGGFAMLPFFYENFVTAHHLMTSHEFANLVALAQMTPGPVGINAATYIGFKELGYWGALVATCGMLVPSLVIVMAVSHFIEPFKNSKIMQGILQGIRPATIGLIAATLVFFSETSLFTAPLKNLFSATESFGISWQGVAIFVFSLALQVFFKLNLLYVLLFSILLALLFYVI